MYPLLVVLLLASAGLVSAQVAAIAYTPAAAPCPKNFTLIRMAGAAHQTLSAQEAAYVASRKQKVLPGAWKAYLKNVEATNTTLPHYVSAILSGSAPPTLGIATSGGGYRAAIFGAGVLNALDGRNASAAAAGSGGLLQAATYLAGLSGGSWLVTSLAQADFPTLHELVLGPTPAAPSPDTPGGWLAQFDVFQPGGANLTVDFLYVESLLQEIAGKFKAGFHVSLIDVWSRALSRHFVNGTTEGNFFSNASTHGAGVTLSGIAGLPSFVSHTQPFPLIVGNLLSGKGNPKNIIPGDEVPLTNPIFEFNVYETGSYDPILAAFTPTKFLGTQNTNSCVTGFDQAAFIAGTSSAIFNPLNTSTPALLNSSVGTIISLVNATFPQPGVRLDSGLYPNPFFGVAKKTFIGSNERVLSLVDGGEDGEVIPIQPLLVKARKVDVILAIDASADQADNFSNGSSLIATQDRAALFPSAYSFPKVPTTGAAFLAHNLTAKPAFFGCNAPAGSGTPLVVYIANGAPPDGQAPVTNTTTDQLAYAPAEVAAMLDQTFAIATQGRPAGAALHAGGAGASGSGAEGHDPAWAACLACAVVDRARARSGAKRSGVCTSCFARYCWD